MFDNLFNNLKLKKGKQHVNKINNLEDTYKKMTDDELKKQTEIFKQRIQNGETLDSLLNETFAVCREASVRVLVKDIMMFKFLVVIIYIKVLLLKWLLVKVKL